MSPIKVTSADKSTVFFVPKDEFVSKQDEFLLLSEVEKTAFEFISYMGTKEGFKLIDHLGKDGGVLEYKASGKRPKEEKHWVIRKHKRGIKTVEDTKIEPISEAEYNKHLKNKER